MDTKTKAAAWLSSRLQLYILTRLSSDIIIHIHQIFNCLFIIRDITVSMDRMLDHTARNTKVHRIFRRIVLHHSIDQPAGKCVTAAHTVQNMKCVGFTLIGLISAVPGLLLRL